MPRGVLTPGATPAAFVQLTDVQAFHVAAFIKDLQGACSPPTVKQHLAALRMLFDWLVTGHVLEVNPAHAVRGPKYVVRKGKTPVLTAGEARELLGSIGTVRTQSARTEWHARNRSLSALPHHRRAGRPQ